ncbi:ubiquinone biosynthesis O-methyltransferase [Halalkalicoccus paucihalophilus]|uniref:Ubiquinone biosynthesis O-methyltransferase n=1 Tax=Halalkalicoccus paucihalophilus TaxID=1008153 RepID=A0A151AE13_9EURY|nr:class I SAM-dependent methyltransferase [Halalkalicoccus paucihalophilus]KYH25908.1 ubiquinone biosynthesis O-methyltransferase [Halalkalicoccus paucihalophilus]
MQPDDVRRDWAERSGRFSPAYYAEIGPNEVSETLVDVLTHYVDDTAAILEVGCGSGRHLTHLREHGFEDLTGIDINDESFSVMAEQYPRLAEAGTFHTGAIEDLVPEFDDGAFDVVYSVETLQHIHPDDEWVFAEFARITSDLLVTVENEGNGPTRGREDAAVSYVDDEFPLYHRDWKRVFADTGAVQLIREPTARDTIRVFRAP